MICLILNIIIFWKQFYGCNFNWSINYFLKNTCMIKNITDMWTQPHWAGVTHISRLSPAWKFKLLFTRITDVSPAFCNCQVKQYPPPPPPPQKKKKQKQKREKTKTKLYLKRLRTWENPSCQRSLEHLTTLCMKSVYFHFFSLSLYHLFFSIVYNRGARLALACFDTPLWW